MTEVMLSVKKNGIRNRNVDEKYIRKNEMLTTMHLRETDQRYHAFGTVNHIGTINEK